jgi:hypothetical protein
MASVLLAEATYQNQTSGSIFAPQVLVSSERQRQVHLLAFLSCHGPFLFAPHPLMPHASGAQVAQGVLAVLWESLLYQELPAAVYARPTQRMGSKSWLSCWLMASFQDCAPWGSAFSKELEVRYVYPIAADSGERVIIFEDARAR